MNNWVWQIPLIYFIGMVAMAYSIGRSYRGKDDLFKVHEWIIVFLILCWPIGLLAMLVFLALEKGRGK